MGNPQETKAIPAVQVKAAARILPGNPPADAGDQHAGLMSSLHGAAPNRKAAAPCISFISQMVLRYSPMLSLLH